MTIGRNSGVSFLLDRTVSSIGDEAVIDDVSSTIAEGETGIR